MIGRPLALSKDGWAEALQERRGLWGTAALVGGAVVSTLAFVATNDPTQISITLGKWRDLASAIGYPVTWSLAYIGLVLAAMIIATVSATVLFRGGLGYSVGPSDGYSNLTTLVFGQTKTAWLRFWGNGTQPLPWQDVHCRVDTKAVSLPQRLLRDEQKAKSRIVSSDKHNSELLALSSYRVITQENTEKPKLHATFSTTSYAKFLVIALGRAGQAAKQKCLSKWRPGDMLPSWLMQGVGVQVAVVTSDKRLICVERSRQGTTPRAGEADIGAVEGLSKHLDTADRENESFRLERVFERAIGEEFGIEPEDIHELELLGLGYDAAYSQVNFIGMARTRLTVDEVVSSWGNNAKSVEEFAHVFGVDIDGDLDGLKAHLGSRKIWSSGLACVYYTLIRLRGRAEIEQALRDFHVGEISHPL